MMWKQSKQYAAAFRLLAVIGGCLLVSPLQAQTPELPRYGADRHLGVSSCASAQCHGAVRNYEDSHIWRNEYRVWSREDPHSKAYSVLKTKASRKMAAYLGLKNAHEAKVCLDCHTDYVPKERRGRKFRISDGVGCEACHGGAERWIKSHTEKNATHAANIEKGLFPSEAPPSRALLCQSCHYGDKNRFATHAIMAAGHPRLSFELDTFTLTQVHYDIDKDYRERKSFPGNVPTWAAGIARNALQNLEVIDNLLFAKPGIFPEIALFDCHACHHAMDDRRMSRRVTTAGLPPGAIRLNDSALVMLYVISLHVSPAQSDACLSDIHALHRATQSGRKAVLAASAKLATRISAIQKDISRFDYSPANIAALRKTLFKLGGKGEFRDYSGAEQATMAVDLLTFALKQEDKYQRQLDRLYKVLEKESDYSPPEFARAMRDFGVAAGG